jgi:outer membrane protein assembly factor BamB
MGWEMQRKIISIGVIAFFLLINIATLSAEEMSIETPKFEFDHKQLLIQKSNEESDNDDVELLWKNSEDVGVSYFTPMFSSDVNDDNIPDILVNFVALDGSNGELIWNTEVGKVCGVGDINNDGKNEIFTKIENKGANPGDYSTLYCLDWMDGTILWDLNIECTVIRNIVVGDTVGDKQNEVIVPTEDWLTRDNQYIYCLDGRTGDVIWKKDMIAGSICAEIADLDADYENEVLVSNKEMDLYCLDGKDGNVIWKYYNGYNIRTICIGDLNSDIYKEIVVESQTYGIRCLSGKDANTFWTWHQEPDNGYRGTFQSILIADMISENFGNEIIAGGVCGVYCLSSQGVELWHAGKANGILPEIVMSAAVGDLDKNGLLDVAAITDRDDLNPGTGAVYALDGQSGSRLWKYSGCAGAFHTIICTNVAGDDYPEVIAKDDSYVCALMSKNYAPNIPIISGPTSIKAGETYHYTISTIDPEEDKVYYYIDWGEDYSYDQKWIGPYKSGDEISISHTWALIGKKSYIIKGKAKDTDGAESDWGTLIVTMPKTKPCIITSFLNFLHNYPLLFQLFQHLTKF